MYVSFLTLRLATFFRYFLFTVGRPSCTLNGYLFVGLREARRLADSGTRLPRHMRESDRRSQSGLTLSLCVCLDRERESFLGDYSRCTPLYSSAVGRIEHSTLGRVIGRRGPRPTTPRGLVWKGSCPDSFRSRGKKVSD